MQPQGWSSVPGKCHLQLMSQRREEQLRRQPILEALAPGELWALEREMEKEGARKEWQQGEG